MVAPIFAPFPAAPSRAEGRDDFSPSADTFAAALPPFALKMNQAITWMADTMTAASSSQSAAADSASAAAQSASTANTAKLAAQKAVTDASAAGAAQVQLAKDQVSLATQQVGLATTNGQAQVALAAQQAQLATTNGKAQVDAAKVVKGETDVIRNQAQMIADAMQTAAGIPSYTSKRGWIFTVKEDGTGIEWRPRHRVGEVLQTAGAVDNTFLPLLGGLYLQSAYPELFAKIGILGAVAGDNWAAYATTVGGAVLTKIRIGKDGVMMGKGTATSTLYRSTDNGLTWTAVSLATALKGSSHNMYSFDTDKRGVWVATAYNSTGTIAYGARSVDNGLTWVEIPVGQLPSGLYTSIATDGNGTWHLGTSNQTIRRSIDNGVTWAIVYNPGGSGSIYALAPDRQGVWVANYGTSIARSTDNGATWAQVSGSQTAAITSTLNDISTNEKGAWVGVGYPPSGVTAPGVYTSYDNGVTWARAVVVGTSVNGDVAYSVTNDRAGAWYIGLASGKVIRSLDNALTWQQLNSTVTGFASSASIDSVVVQGTDLLALGSAVLRKSLSSTPYDSAALFKLPDLPIYKGVTNYIKAKEAA